MISSAPLPHRATYDADGNIVLPFEDYGAGEQGIARSPVTRRVGMVSQLTRAALEEGIRQVRVTAQEAAPLAHELRIETDGLLRRTWLFLTQPVLVPGRRQPKELSRMRLFVMDTVRFGMSFVLLFAGLFTALNYQSFWQIASARLEPLLHGPTVADASPLTELPSLPDASSKIPGDLLSFLPEVGPPENRVVIPKLDLNVPLVEPPLDALLREDWNQVERDIQEGLQRGVVHYPGTARPGQAGNFFLTGHSSYYPWSPGEYKTVFARLHELSAGDQYMVYFRGNRHVYRVTEKKEVRPTDTSVLDQPSDRRAATLMTCTPVGTTLRRLILVAQEIDPQTGKALEPGETMHQPTRKVAPLEALPI